LKNFSEDLLFAFFFKFHSSHVLYIFCRCTCWSMKACRLTGMLVWWHWSILKRVFFWWDHVVFVILVRFWYLSFCFRSCLFFINFLTLFHSWNVMFDLFCIIQEMSLFFLYIGLHWWFEGHGVRSVESNKNFIKFFCVGWSYKRFVLFM
jgi:hypothetical protein